ncbi:transporter [Galbibacter sp. EGI 63066]|uniref:transporter n=1 Tax=Galbibacter sp. EGI 63066 TaxID=2993559 RepID=UPI0022489BFD|nr:transporter [Galbibacter sp. EGI 63066]MCX2678917.1 transporter [Galbibacter sp. EGI 63066]
MELIKHIKLFVIGAVSLLSIHSTWAQGPPVFTDTPIMLGLEGGGIRTFGNIISKENANAYMQVLAVPYNINQKWQIGAIAPYVSISPNGMENRSGIGDVKVFTKYQLFQKDGKGKTWRGLIKLTETFPTGNSSEVPALGTGAYQTTVSLVHGYITTAYGIYGELGYNFTGEGLPDNLIYNLALGVPLLPQQYPPKQLNLYLEFNGNLVFDDVGNNLFLSPGIQYIAGRRLLFESGIQFPLDDSAPSGQKNNHILRIGARLLIF